MSLFQRFRLGNHIEPLALRKDTNGAPFSQMTDIQDIFPGALRFKVHGVNILFLENEQGQRYEPKRIAYYPDAIIDVVVATAPLDFPAAPVFSDVGTVSLSTLSIHPLPPKSSKVVTQFASPHPTAIPFGQLVGHPMSALSSIGTNISQLQHQLEQSTDQQSAHHQQTQRQLLCMMQQQNAILKELAASKEREEQMLQEQAESKLREEQMLINQQETIDRLIIAQQRLEAILVQNYELHEYPIPRLFVILPDSYERWDPRNILAERFRLFFLCECGEHCDANAGSPSSPGQLTIAAASHTTNPIPVKNSLHLAKHEGYELSRPTEFFDRYGLYLLGMLRILKHCLAVAAVVTPAVALADNTVKDVMDGVRSISESTMKAVDASIDFLEKKLDDHGTDDGVVGAYIGTREEEDKFSGLAALEGADLRRLDSFLRNKDADKILGNLYRTTTEAGHVKWVCLDHYRQIYREAAMASFLQSVETNGGTYDPYLGKVSITLKSSTAAKDFFSRLSQQAQSVTALEATFNWSFGSSDLVLLVDKIAQSNVRNFELDLVGKSDRRPLGSLLRPGKGRYHSLLSLLSNTKIKSLTFTSVNFIGPRTSGFPKNYRPSLLQSFRYLGCITMWDDARLAEIISHCPQLVDLRFGPFAYTSSGTPKVDQAIGTLSKLESLHRYHLYSSADNDIDGINGNATPYGSVALSELVELHLPYLTFAGGLLESAIRRSSAKLETLILRDYDETGIALDVTYILGSSWLDTIGPNPFFARLTHLELLVDLSLGSLQWLSRLLPSLALVHLGVGKYTVGFLAHVNLESLKSLTLWNIETGSMTHAAVAHFSTGCQVETLRLHKNSVSNDLSGLLGAAPLKRIHLANANKSDVKRFLQRTRLSGLQLLAIDDEEYDWDIEAVIAAKNAALTEGFVLQLPIGIRRDVHEVNSRDVHGSSTKLARCHVRAIQSEAFSNEYFSSFISSYSL